jgi:hypothetical protein
MSETRMRDHLRHLRAHEGRDVSASPAHPQLFDLVLGGVVAMPTTGLMPVEARDLAEGAAGGTIWQIASIGMVG